MSDDILPSLSRRTLLGAAMAGGVAGGLVLPARADTPKRGGKLTVAGYASSTPFRS